MTFRPLISRDEALERLRVIFPREAFDTVLSNQLAATAVVAMLYVDAVVPDIVDIPPDAVWARPTTCLWLSDEAVVRDGAGDRLAWRKAASQGNKKVFELLKSWRVGFDPWYADNSRETLRDETFPKWLDHGAIRVRPDVKTTSSKPRWALTTSFADLFNPELTGDALHDAIEDWRANHMSPGDRFRIQTLQQRERQVHGVEVTLPGGAKRSLEPGDASLILKGVVELWAPNRLGDAVVLTISEPGDKVYTADRAMLESLGVVIDPSTLLPDAVIVDIDTAPPTFWIIEAVASDGPITEDRRSQLLQWAHDHHIPEESCNFLTAFLSRGSQAAKRRLKDIATNTYAWYADEPGRELAWYEL